MKVVILFNRNQNQVHTNHIQLRKHLQFHHNSFNLNQHKLSLNWCIHLNSHTHLINLYTNPNSHNHLQLINQVVTIQCHHLVFHHFNIQTTHSLNNLLTNILYACSKLNFYNLMFNCRVLRVHPVVINKLLPVLVTLLFFHKLLWINFLPWYT